MLMNAVIAVMPAKNEAATVHSVVRATLATCPVLLVNDKSEDNTAELARDAGARILDLTTSTGYGAALLAGMRAALAEGYDTVVTLDADGAHYPRDLGSMLSVHAATGAMLTIGDRFTNCGAHSVPSAKYWANHFASTIVNRLLGTQLRDVACGFRVMDSTLVSGLIQGKCSAGFGLTFQILQHAVVRKARIVSSPVVVHYTAEELHATTQQEMLDAIVAVLPHLPEMSPEALVFRAMKELVSAMAPVSVRVGNEILCLHPLHLSYVFQRHPPELSAPKFGTFIDYDAALRSL